MEPFVPARRDDADESLASFVRRRLGEEALARVAQPMVGGIYTADPERLSLRATMPRFADMEREHGSVVRALVAARRRATGAQAHTTERGARQNAIGSASGPRYELFVALRKGMAVLPRTLAESLPADTIAFQRSVSAIERAGDAWRLATSTGPVKADAVCLALPSYVAADVLESVSSELASELEAIEHASTATVTLAWRRDDISHALDGFGFVVPAVERRTTLACTFSSVKFAGRAPAGHVLLRAFVGGALAPENFALDDDVMTGAVVSDLRDLIGVRRPPMWSIVSRFPRSMPQYHVGHLDRVRRIEAALAGLPGLVLAGNAYIGAGIPDTIRSANAAAERLANALALTRAAA
jgi:oxygen-dependent protoporphyrinogen oxidase